MEEKYKVCPECGSADVEAGMLQGRAALMFISDSDRKKLIPKMTLVRAFACKSCGAVFGMHLEQKEK